MRLSNDELMAKLKITGSVEDVKHRYNLSREQVIKVLRLLVSQMENKENNTDKRG